MSLVGLAPSAIKPTALALNILVACVTTWQFFRRGHFSWTLFWPFALLSIPAAFLGGYVDLPTPIFKVLVGVVLLASAIRFLVRTPDDTVTSFPALALSLPLGAGLGFVSGLTGTGGGIFLTPLLLSMHWARAPSSCFSAIRTAAV